MTTTHEDRVEAFLHEYRTKRRELAEAKARVRKSERSMKRIRALAMKAAAVRGHKTNAAQEREWEASEQYEKWEDEDVAAVLDRDVIQGEVDADEMRWETWRTRRADRRAEMKLV